jgi:xanthine/CO dehydrogenase XdhC/CoxF family maturation factor
VKEIKLFVGQLSLYIKSGVKFAIATVVNVDGSAYRRPGARMLINENGDWHGGISGGCLEGDMLKKAQMSMLSNQNKLVKYDTREDDPFELGVGLGCNGLIEILISPDLEYAKCLLELLIAHVQSSDPTILEHSFHLNSTHSSFVQINSTQPFVSVLSKEDSEEVLIQHQSQLLALENELIFVEYLPAIPRIVVYGNLFDSSSLIELCVFLSWDICWIGNPLKMSSLLKTKVQSFFHWDDTCTIKNNDAIVLMTHDFDRDVAILTHLITINFKGYVGILGPLKRMQKITKQLELLSVNMDDKTLFGPIGLDIGAEGPNEIALSIVSEIIAFNSSRDGGSLKNRIKSIHTK